MQDFISVEGLCRFTMATVPLVSIILPTYNRAQTIGRSVKSVLTQTYSDFELIIVDDGSTDSTSEVVKSFRDSRIHYMQTDRNGGAALARNLGLRASRGEFIAFQDSDDEWFPDKLKRQVDILSSAPPTVAFVYSDMIRVLLSGEETYFKSPTVRRGELLDTKGLEYQVHGIGLVTVMLRRACLDEVGYFDEGFPRFIDLDLFIRLAKAFAAQYIREPLAYYYEGEGIQTNNNAYIRARLLLLKKYRCHLLSFRKFRAHQYLLVAQKHVEIGQKAKGMAYLARSLAILPTYRRTLGFCFRSLFRRSINPRLHKVL